MPLLDGLSGTAWPPTPFLEWLAALVVRRCQQPVPPEVPQRAATMTLARASGYLRARLGGVVVAQTRLSLLRAGLPPDLTAAVGVAAIENLVSLVLGNLLARPAGTRLRRRAA